MTSGVMDLWLRWAHCLAMTSSTNLARDPLVDVTTPARVAGQRLRNTLRLNASTSLVGGLVAAIAPGVLDRLLGTGQPLWVRGVGIALGVFAIDVALVAASRTTRLWRFTPVIVLADVGWVAATIATIAAGWYNTAGAVLMATVGVAVAGFATRQLFTFRRLVEARGVDAINESPPVEVAHVEARVDASAEVMWEIVTDHELYGELAPNLGAVHATAPDGPALTRSCSNRSDQEWSESCTLWDDGHRFEIAVDTSDYPYPLSEMRGSWWVHQTDARASIVGMDFRYQPRPGIKGRVFAALMQAGFPIVLHRILRGWRREAIRRAGKVSS